MRWNANAQMGNMAINANHPFEELNGIRCAVVEKNCTPERVSFLKYILEGNGFEVVVMASPPPKAAPAPKPAAVTVPATGSSASAAEAPAATPLPSTESTGSATGAPVAGSAQPAATASQPAAPPAETAPPPPAPESFTVGVTDVTFNVTNAIYGRLLRSPDGHVVTMAFWQQKEDQSRDDIPYYAKSI